MQVCGLCLKYYYNKKSSLTVIQDNLLKGLFLLGDSFCSFSKGPQVWIYFLNVSEPEPFCIGRLKPNQYLTDVYSYLYLTVSIQRRNGISSPAGPNT